MVSRLQSGLPSVARILLAYLAIAIVGSGLARAEKPDDVAAVLFAERCSTCHNIGGGAKVGPDLLGVIKRREKSWFARFVRGPSTMIDGGDPIAAELGRKFAPVRMPDQPLSEAEVDGVWAYFTTCNDKGGCQPVSVGPRWATDASVEEIAYGRDLFFGERHLQRGGAPCFACHAVRDEGAASGIMGGGTLGPELTFAYARLGEKGTEPLLALMGSTVMQPVYAHAQLEEDERYALKAYLGQLSRDGTFPRRTNDFFYIGLEGMALVLGAFALRAGVGARGRGQTPGGGGS